MQTYVHNLKRDEDEEEEDIEWKKYLFIWDLNKRNITTLKRKKEKKSWIGIFLEFFRLAAQHLGMSTATWETHSHEWTEAMCWNNQQE